MTRKYLKIVLCTGAALVSIFTSAIATMPPLDDNERSQDPPESQSFWKGHPAVEHLAWNGDYKYTISRMDQNGRGFAELTLFGIRRIDSDTRESYRTQYGKLYEGDIVPMFTALYRVAEVDAERNDMTAKRIDEAKLLEEIGVQRESYALPLKAGVRLGVVDCRVISLNPGEGGGAMPTARMTASYSIPIKPMFAKGIKLDFPSLRTGDLIEVAESKYKVRKIVLPDSRRQIRGWVELTPVRDAIRNRVTNDSAKSESRQK